MRSRFQVLLFVTLAAAGAGSVVACADETSLNPQPLPPEDDNKRGEATGGSSSGGGFGGDAPPNQASDAGKSDSDAGGD